MAARGASAPAVVVDIAPVHSLVSQVMQGVGEPRLLIPAEASPHNYSLRPSEAKALASADLVFWIGEDFTPWLQKAMKHLAASAQTLEVLAIKGTQRYRYREGASFEAHHDDHAQHHDKHHHDHRGHDPHAWLDPENAKRWVAHISDTLSMLDPENASSYRRNAAEASASLDALIASTGKAIRDLGNPRFIVFHDAYQYFEKRFGIAAAGAIALGDAEDPSPARIQEIRDTVNTLGVRCVFTEPQYNAGLVKNVFADTGVSTLGVMDPLGAKLSPGHNHYQQLIQGMVASLRQCR
ncbi:MAG: zinc ABC transporter substrate-binding protein [Cellvibrionaceae bacterium]|nr:zinc ABC transporter substrate-binding protein [Cellvibrionaceae bacterium]